MERELVATGEARIISLAEAAKLLGVSYPTTVRLATEGELKAFRVRKAWRTSTMACGVPTARPTVMSPGTASMTMSGSELSSALNSSMSR